MVHFFSFCMITCFSIFNIYGQGGLQLLATAAAVHCKEITPDLLKYKTAFQEEGELRKSLAATKDPKTKRQLHTKIDITRNYYKKLLSLGEKPTLSEIRCFLASYQLLDQFVAEQLHSSINYEATDRYTKDTDLLHNMRKKLLTMFKIDKVHAEGDLTQSVLSINRFQATSNSLLELKIQRSKLEEQVQELQSKKLELDSQIEFEELKAEFTKDELQKQQQLKKRAEKKELADVANLDEQIEQLIKQRNDKTQKVATLQTSGTKMEDLLNGWHLTGQ